MGERERSTSQLGGAGAIDAFLGKGTKITGKLVFEGPGRIEGQVEGEISAHDTLAIGDGAIVNAKVSGTSIIIEGQVTGDVAARHRLELRASGRVRGDITAPTLVMHEGAILEGQCSMSEAGGKSRREKPGATALSSLDRGRDVAAKVPSTLSR